MARRNRKFVAEPQVKILCYTCSEFFTCPRSMLEIVNNECDTCARKDRVRVRAILESRGINLGSINSQGKR